MKISAYFKWASVIPSGLAVFLGLSWWTMSKQDEPIPHDAFLIVCAGLAIALVLYAIGTILDLIERRRQQVENVKYAHMRNIKPFDEDYKMVSPQANHDGNIWNAAFRTNRATEYDREIENRIRNWQFGKK